jgi:hypothetical protein
MENHWKPGEPAPQQGYYLAHNVFGSPSKPRWVVRCEAGETLPKSGRGYTWLLVGKIGEPDGAATDKTLTADIHAASPPEAGAVA